MKNDQFIELPPVLESSNDYMALNTDQEKAFRGRLQHCAEMALALGDAQSKSTSELFAMIDDAELDAISIMSAFTDPAKTVSPYRVHSSWLFECNKKEMASKVDRSTAMFLGYPAFLIDSSGEALARWLQDWATAMRSTFLQLARATSFSEAVAQLVVIDALMAILLVFAAASRLSPHGR